VLGIHGRFIRYGAAMTCTVNAHWRIGHGLVGLC
jgi:hypothetical protein